MIKSLSSPWLWFCILSPFSGCVSEGREPVHDWKGLHQDDLVEILGEPADRVALPGGDVQLIFDQGRLRQHAGTHETWICRMFFELDSKGFVQRVSTSGC